MANPLSVSVDLSGLMQVEAMLRQGLFENLAGAVRSVALTGVERWQRAVQAAPLWEGERDAYSNSIRAEQIGPLEWVLRADYKYVEDIESGRPPYDMKKMLNTSLRVRVSSKGRRYLIIPMRHNTPGNTALARPMPKDVHAQAQRLKPSEITGHGQRLSGTGAWDINTKSPAQVRARKYLWGGRLAAGAAPKLSPSHKSDPYAGMVRFKADGGSGKRSSVYLSFRVMVEGSPGWIIPARPGMWIAKAVAESLRPIAETEFGAAIQREL